MGFTHGFDNLILLFILKNIYEHMSMIDLHICRNMDTFLCMG